MENKAYEASGNLRILHTSFYTFFILAVLFVSSSMASPFRYHSFGFTFTNFLDANYYRHYMFFFCNGILLFLFLESGSKHTSETAYSLENQALGPQVVTQNQISFASGLEEETELTHEDMETEQQVIHVCSEHENDTNVKQIVVDEDHIEDQETEVALHVDSHEHEIVAEVVVEEEEEEEVHEFQQKCEAFIKKVKQSMHHEATSYPMIDIDSHNYADR